MKNISNATILPLKGNMDKFTAGVYASDGTFLEDSLVYRGNAAQYAKPAEYLHGTYIYGGCLFEHFGHFI